MVGEAICDDLTWHEERPSHTNRYALSSSQIHLNDIDTKYNINVLTDSLEDTSIGYRLDCFKVFDS